MYVYIYILNSSKSATFQPYYIAYTAGKIQTKKKEEKITYFLGEFHLAVILRLNRRISVLVRVRLRVRVTSKVRVRVRFRVLDLN